MFAIRTKLSHVSMFIPLTLALALSSLGFMQQTVSAVSPAVAPRTIVNNAHPGSPFICSPGESPSAGNIIQAEFTPIKFSYNYSKVFDKQGGFLSCSYDASGWVPITYVCHSPRGHRSPQIVAITGGPSSNHPHKENGQIMICDDSSHNLGKSFWVHTDALNPAIHDSLFQRVQIRTTEGNGSSTNNETTNDVVVLHNIAGL